MYIYIYIYILVCTRGYPSSEWSGAELSDAESSGTETAISNSAFEQLFQIVSSNRDFKQCALNSICAH